MPSIDDSIGTPNLEMTETAATTTPVIMGVPTVSSIPTIGSLPVSMVGTTEATSQFTGQSVGSAIQGVFQAVSNTGTQAISNANAQATGTASLDTATQQTTIGTPGQVYGVSASESSYKTQAGTLMSLVTVSWTPVPFDPAYAGATVYFTGYHGGTTPVAMASTAGTATDVAFLTDITGESVTVTVLSQGFDGTSPAFSSAPTTTVALTGVTGLPAAPGIASGGSLVSTQTGFQFTFNIITGLGSDIIDGYGIYANSTNSFPGKGSAWNGTSGRVAYISHPTSSNGTYTYTYSAANAATMYFWVTCVNVQGSESNPTSAGTATAVTPIDPNGNLVFRNAQQVNGVASNPTNSTVGGWYTIPDMGIAITTHGKPVLVLFNGFFQNNGAGAQANVQICRQDSGGTTWLGFPANTVNTPIMTLVALDTTCPAGNHVYYANWYLNSAGNVQAVYTYRLLSVVELG